MSEPVLQAFLTADKIIREDNGKHTLVGIFSNISVAEEFPSTGIPPWFIYIAIVNVSKGKTNVSVNLVHDGTKVVLFSGGGEITANESGRSVEMVLPVSPAFLSPGQHILTLNINGQPLAYRVIEVIDTKQQSGVN